MDCMSLLVETKGARWPSGLERWTGDRTVRGSNPTAENFSLRNFGNSVYPALPVSFGGDTKGFAKLKFFQKSKNKLDRAQPTHPPIQFFFF